MTACVIHRFWHSTSKQLPEEVICGLKSFAPSSQILWCYKNYQRPRIRGVVCRNARQLLPELSFKALLKKKVPIQLIKDIIQMRALYRFGGWFIDLDYIWTGKRLPTTRFVFSTIARKYKDSHTMGRPAVKRPKEYGTLTLGCIKGPKGADLFHVAADLFLAYAQSLPTPRARVFGMKEYLHNSFQWEAIILQTINLWRYIQPPCVFNPMPYWLKSQHLPDSSWTYVIPTAATLKARSCTIVPWTRTWPSSLIREVEAMINALRTSRNQQPLKIKYKQRKLF